MSADRPDTHLARLGIAIDDLVARNLRHWSDATNLEVVEVDAQGREHRLEPHAADAWRRLKSAAALAGHDIYIVSAFRSAARQAEIIRRKLRAGQSLEEILTVSAPPGYSEHHTGRAVDISTPGVAPLEEDFEATPAFQWLCGNAARHGFVLSYPADNPYGYQYEPWHWCHRDI